MKKFLITAVAFGVMGTASGWAQGMDYSRDKFEDFAAKMRAASQGQGASPSANTRTYDTPQTPEELQAMMEREAAEQQENLEDASWKLARKMQSSRKEQMREEEQLFARDIVADSKIASVTVYSDKAKVIRIAEVDVPSGAHTVVFKGLSSEIDTESIHAEATSNGDLKLGATETRPTIASREATPREADLFTKIQSVKDQLAQIDAEEAALSTKAAFFSNIGRVALAQSEKSIEQGAPKPGQWTEAGQSVYTGIAETLKAYFAEELKARDLHAQLVDARGELTQIQKAQNGFAGTPVDHRSFAVLLPVDAKGPAHVRIELSYQARNATWTPLYDAHLNMGEKGGLQLVQYGVVRQQTGEDWNDVALTLSTAHPERSASLPEIHTRWIDGGAPMPVSAAVLGGGQPDVLAEWRAKTEAKRVKMEREQQPEEKEAEQPEVVPMVTPIHPQPTMRLGPAPFVPANINTGGFITEYTMAEPCKVSSDNSQVKVKIGSFDVESKMEVQIEPQLSTDAFLVVKSKLLGSASILPGPVSLYRGDAYVGQSALPLLRPGEEHDLYFGIDDEVAVKHNVLKDEKKEAGLISRNNLLERAATTEVQNLHAAPVDIVVKQAVPVSRNEKVRVDIDKEATTPGYVADADNIKGLLNWQFRMEPKEKKDLKLDWTVSWPSDFTVTGL